MCERVAGYEGTHNTEVRRQLSEVGFAFHLVRADSVLFLPLTVNTRLAGLRDSGQFSSSVSYLTVGVLGS